jgi:hypothetical protein
MEDGKGVHCKFVPGTFRPLANKDNDYLMDRAAQKRGVKPIVGADCWLQNDADRDERHDQFNRREPGMESRHVQFPRASARHRHTPAEPMR